MVKLVVQRGEKKEKWKMESEFSSVFNKTSSGLWQRNGYMDKVEKNDIEMEEEEGEMVKWIQWIQKEREADWELIPIR